MSAVCGFATLIFGVFQYTANLEAERAAQTLHLVNTWRDDGYRAHYQALADATEIQVRQITDTEAAILANDEDLRDRVAAKVARLVIEQDTRAEDSLDEVVYFFNILGLCVDSRLCSDDTAARFFDNTLLEFHQIFASEIEERQNLRPNFANGLELLVAQFQVNDI